MSNSSPSNKTQLPNNGVAIEPRVDSPVSHRSYEIYQRERPGESTEKIGPGQLTADAQLVEPHPTLSVLRENYPCYRDWAGNAYWLSRYNDVTSIFADRANFSVQTRAQACGIDTGTDFSQGIEAHRLWAQLIDDQLDELCARGFDRLATLSSPDLSIDYALWLCNQLQRLAFGLGEEQADELAVLLWHIQRADSWEPNTALKGKSACAELLTLLKSKSSNPALPLSPEDLLATVLGFETRTLHGWIANLAQLWLTQPNVANTVRAGRAQLKIATLETMRFTPPVAYAHCRARHEVERFGRLLPQGALLRLSAEAANRDPRIFQSPDSFLPDRADICHREARGQYRADGLATGIAFGLGLPSRHPAVPEDRPRSLYALTRDATVAATSHLFERFATIKPVGTLRPPHALTIFEPMIAWSLPVTLE